MSEADPSSLQARARPWLLDLAVTQQDSGPHPGDPTYDDEEQMSYLREPDRQLAIESGLEAPTKKADRETGEDQKGY